MLAVPVSILLWLLVALPALGQVSNPDIVPVAVAPSGACSANLPVKLKTPDGTLWTCQNGVYGQVVGSGAFPAAITSPSINGDIFVDGVVNTTINAAWTACQNKAANCALQVGAGTFALTTTLTEPETAYSTSIFGRGSDKTVIQATAAMTNMLFKANTVVGAPFIIQGVTFQCNNSSTINAQNGVKLQWARYVILNDVKVINCGTMDIDLGEDTGTTHQFGGVFYNLQTDYNEGVFTGPAGGGGPTPPAFGIQTRASVVDSKFYGMVLRNAHTASLHNDGGAITFYDVHGFGFSAVNYLSYIPSYIIEESGVNNNWYGTYADSPNVAAIHFTAAGPNAVINDGFLGGNLYWNPTVNGSPVTYPSTDAIMQVDGAATGDLKFSGFSCFNLPNTSNFLIGAGSLGARVRYDDISGCSTTFMTYRFSVANRGYNFSDLSATFNLQWQGLEGHYATTANGTNTWFWEDSGRVVRAQMSDDGNFKPAKLTLNGGQTMTSPPEMVAYLGTVNPNTLTAQTNVPFSPKAAITITRIEWNLSAQAVGCTTSPVLTVAIGGTAQTFATTIGNGAFVGLTDGTQAIAAGVGNVGLRVTTAPAGCTTTPGTTLSGVVHYLMQ
jgi:hypothetical protein